MEEKKQPLVSVIVPAYNAENYIAVCLDRILAQDYQNLEIIVVDDGSDDGTVDVCVRFASLDERVKFVQAQHGGASSARNEGIKAATGDYITFMDADDYAEKNLISKYVKAYESWGRMAAVVIAGMYWVDPHNRFAKRKERLLEEERGYKRDSNYLLERYDTATLSWLKMLNFITNKCYRGDIIRENGILFDTELKIAEDLNFNIDYLEASEGFLGVINKPLYSYVKHGDDSLSARYFEGSVEQVKESYKRLLNFTADQSGVSVDDIYVIKSIYLMDWVSRLCMLIDDKSIEMTSREKYRYCNDEIRGVEFRRLLKDSKMGKKITGYRFYTLYLGSFRLFIWLRKFYHKLKHVD